MIVYQLLLILHKKIQFYIFMFEAWNVAKGHKVQGDRILSQGTVPPQTYAGTKTTLNELYTAISKQENSHPEAPLLVAGDFNAGKLKSVLPNFYKHVKCATIGEKTL